MKKVTVMRAEVFLVAVFVVLGMGAWFVADRWATKQLKSSEPSLEAERLKRHVPWRRDGLAMTQKEQKATGDQLIKARLQQYEQQAALEAFPQATAAADAQKRQEAQTQYDATTRHVEALKVRLGQLQDWANVLRREVEENDRAAAVEYAQQRIWYRLWKALMTLGGMLALLLLAFSLLGLLLIRPYVKKAREGGHEPNTWLVVQATCGLLVILVAYQTLEIAGAAFFGALVLLFFLWRMPWERVRAEEDEGDEEEAGGGEAEATAGAKA